MEIYNKKENPNLSPDTNQPPIQNSDTDIHEDGVDILTGSGVREEEDSKSGEFVEVRAEEKTDVTKSIETPAVEPILEKPAPQTDYVPQKPIIKQEPVAIPDIPKSSEPIKPPVDVKNDPSIKSIRTFKTDAEEAVKYKNISAVDIAVAEQKKKDFAPIQYVEDKKSHPGAILAVVILLIVVLGGGWFYWFKTSQVKTAPVVTVSAKTIVPYSKGSTIVLRGDDNPLELIAAKLGSANTTLGEIYALIPTLTATSTKYADISLVLNQTKIPGKLERSLAPDYMFGTYTYDSTSPFIILTNTFFQNSFAGMLEWEKDIKNDLLPIIRISNPNESVVEDQVDVFQDTVISNIDARILRNSDGKTILVYSFVNTKTLVIATNENTMSYLIDKLLAVRSVQ